MSNVKLVPQGDGSLLCSNLAECGFCQRRKVIWFSAPDLTTPFRPLAENGWKYVAVAPATSSSTGKCLACPDCKDKFKEKPDVS